MEEVNSFSLLRHRSQRVPVPAGRHQSHNGVHVHGPGTLHHSIP